MYREVYRHLYQKVDALASLFVAKVFRFQGKVWWIVLVVILGSRVTES